MSLPKRVLYVRQAPYPWDIRVEKICAALQAAGCEVEILARRGAGEPATTESNGLRIHRVGPERPRFVSLPLPGNPLWQSTLNARVSTFRPDLLIARDVPVALFAANAAQRARIPWVIDMAEHYPEAMRSWKKYRSNFLLSALVGPLRVPDRIERRAVRCADGILPVCEEQKQRLVREYGVAPQQIVPVLNTPSRSSFAEVAPSGPSRTRFAYHGFVGQDRDLKTVVRGFDLAAAKNPNITLQIAGDGESLPDLRAEVARLTHRDRITLSGAFARADVTRLYAETDFGVVACAVNPFTESTIPNKFFEYAACGRPFLFTATPPTLRLMNSMRCGLAYVGGSSESVAEAMRQIVVADYDLLARNGREAVEREFNWETDSARMLEFLQQIMAKRAHA